MTAAPNAKHRTGILKRSRHAPQLDAEAEAAVQSYVAHYAEDEPGGLAAMSNRELSILRDVAVADAIIERAFNWAAAQPTIIDAEGNLLPVLGKSLLAYINSKRLGLVALGLRPQRSDQTPDLQTYLASAAQRAAQPAPSNAADAVPADAPAADTDEASA